MQTRYLRHGPPHRQKRQGRLTTGQLDPARRPSGRSDHQHTIKGMAVSIAGPDIGVGDWVAASVGGELPPDTSVKVLPALVRIGCEADVPVPRNR
jgi:hypothetical protein